MGAKTAAKGATSKQPQKTQKKPKEGGSGGGKAKKKKWSKGKVRDKLNNLVLFDKVRGCRRRGGYVLGCTEVGEEGPFVEFTVYG